MHWFLVFTTLLVISTVSGQKGRYKASKDVPDIPRQNSCSIKSIYQTSQKAALCSHWPNKAELTSEVVELTVHGATLQTLNSEIIEELGLKLNVLRLKECRIKSLNSNAFQNQQGLKILDLSDNELTSIPQAIFRTNRHLREIRLQNNRISTIDRGTFAQLDSLEILDLGGNQLKQIPADLPKSLRQFHLKQNKITEMTTMQLPNLETLNVCDNDISLFTENMVSFSKLEVLCIGNKELKQESTGFKMLSNLKELTLKGKGADAQLKPALISAISTCQQLKTLRIEKYSLNSLTIVSQLKYLQVLVLHEVHVTEIPTAKLFQDCPNLNTLDLKGSIELAQTLLRDYSILKSWQNIKYLGLRECGIETLSWFPMPPASRPTSPLPMPSLTAIDISDNKLDCEDPSTKNALCYLKSITKDFTIYEPKPRILNGDKQSAENKTLPWYEQNIMGMHNPDDTKCQNDQSVRQMSYDDCPDHSTGPFRPGFKGGDDVEGPAPTEEIPGTQQELRQEEIWYIVLGVLLLILVIIAIVLGIVCYRVKRRGVETIPESGACEETQSFKKLKQSSSEEGLLDSNKTQRK